MVKSEQPAEPVTPQKVPKAVQQARDALRGMEINADTIKKILSAKDYNNLCCNFRNQMSASVKSEYKALSGDEERRNWIAQYVLDPHTTVASGFNKTTAYIGNETLKEYRWLHESEIASEQFLNSKEMAAMLTKSGELESRPSEFPSLAAEGYKQYWFNVSRVRASHGWTQEAGTSLKSDLKEEEYKEVNAKILSESSGSGKRKTPTPKVESEDAKRLKAAVSAKGVSTRKLKSLIDRIGNKIKTQEKDDLPRIVAKGYPAEMKDFLEKQVKDMRALVTSVNSVYLAEVQKTEKDTDIDSVLSDSQLIDEAFEKLDAGVKLYEKKTSVDIKKLAAD